MDCSMLLRTHESFIGMSRAPANFGFPIFRAPSNPAMRKLVRHSAGGASGMKDAWVVEMRFRFNPTLARKNPVCRLCSFFPLLFLTPLDRVGKLEETLLLTSVVLRYFGSCLALGSRQDFSSSQQPTHDTRRRPRARTMRSTFEKRQNFP